VFLGQLEGIITEEPEPLTDLQDKVAKLKALQQEIQQEVDLLNEGTMQRKRFLDDIITGFTLNPKSTKAQVNTRNVFSNSKRLEKITPGLIAVTCHQKLGVGLHWWSLQYLKPWTSSDGSFFCGVQSEVRASTLESFNEPISYGIRVTTPTCNRNGRYVSGQYTQVGNLVVDDQSTINFTLDNSSPQPTLTVSSVGWSETIPLPPDMTWYPHFNPYGASFVLLD
jgi:hypothetical protein